MGKFLKILFGLILVAGLGFAAFVYTSPDVSNIVLPPPPPAAAVK